MRGAFVEGCTYGVASALIYLAEAPLFYIGAILIAKGTYSYLQLVVFSASIGSKLIAFSKSLLLSSSCVTDCLLPCAAHHYEEYRKRYEAAGIEENHRCIPEDVKCAREETKAGAHCQGYSRHLRLQPSSTIFRSSPLRQTSPRASSLWSRFIHQLHLLVPRAPRRSRPS